MAERTDKRGRTPTKPYIGDRTDLTAMEILNHKIAEIEAVNVYTPPMPGYTLDENCALLSLGNLRTIRDALIKALKA